MTMIEPYHAPVPLPVGGEPPLLHGTHASSLCPDTGLNVPLCFRAAFAEGAILTCGYEGCLYLLPPASWQSLVRQARTIAPASEQGRLQRRRIFASALAVVLDADGNFVPPPDLLTYAGIREQVIFAGVDSYIELWAAHRWLKMRDQLARSAYHAMQPNP